MDEFDQWIISNEPLVGMSAITAVDLEQEIQREGEEIKRMTQVMKEISDRKERASRKTKVLQALAWGTGEEVKLLNERLNQIKVEKKRLEEENILKDNYIRSLVDERKQFLSRISELSEDVSNLRRSDQDRSHLLSEKKELLSRVTVLTKEVGSLQRLDQVHKQLVKDRDELLSANAVLSEKIRSLERTDHERVQLVSENRELFSRVSSLTEEISALKQSDDQERGLLLNEKKELVSTVTLLTEDLSSLQQLVEEKMELQSTINALREEVQVLRRSDQERVQLVEERERFLSRIDSLTEEGKSFRRLEQERTQLLQEREDLLSTVSRLTEDINTLKGLEQERVLLADEKQELLNSVKGLMDEVTFLKLMDQERGELIADKEKLLSDIGTLTEDINTLMRLNTEGDGDRKQLASEREELESRVTALTEEIGKQKQLNEERAQLYEMQREELELEMKQRVVSMELQLKDSEKKFRALESSAKASARSLQQQQDSLRNNLQGFILQLRDFRADSDGLKKMVFSFHEDWQKWIDDAGVGIQESTKAATGGYQKLLIENRKLYNEVQDLRGNIRVFCRVKPMDSAHAGMPTIVDYVGENGDIMIRNPHKQGRDSHRMFKFNKVFGHGSTQEQIYRDTQPLIRSVLDGFNVCIFAYGQTGSGKTYTMSGPRSSTEELDFGVNYRALHDLFKISESRRDTFQYEIGVQMIEIYNEQVRDLLSASATGQNKRLDIRKNSQQLGFNVPDACLMSVRSKEDVLELMAIGEQNRAVGATALNDRSSRSHSVVTVHVHAVDLTTGSRLRGCLHLVDLAGSERVDKSEVTGDRLKEAQHINKSLSALGDVIAALAQRSTHIPYRNSKLTQLLQDSLGGHAKALMVVHMNPDVDSFGETLSTLKFAERVAAVELGLARSNKEPGELRELKEQVAVMKESIAQKDAEINRLRDLRISSLGGADRLKGKGTTALISHKLIKESSLARRNKYSASGSPRFHLGGHNHHPEEPKSPLGTTTSHHHPHLAGSENHQPIEIRRPPQKSPGVSDHPDSQLPPYSNKSWLHRESL
ncbi:hypothetical protein R1flu_018922 [Riccia fluitans]|uniref:Kinesin motor domain-containing protein n=1 Tax=Riccia fluitans TaxID=41844 RepID=A0ABD1ZL34_9MARC